MAVLANRWCLRILFALTKLVSDVQRPLARLYLSFFPFVRSQEAASAAKEASMLF